MSFSWTPKTQTAIVRGKNISNEKKDSGKVKNLTKALMKKYLKEVPSHKDKGGVRLYPIAVVGEAGYGKSILVMNILRKTQQHFGRENVNTVYCQVLIQNRQVIKIWVSEIDDKPIQLLVLDDCQGIETMKLITQLAEEINKMRHTYMNKSGKKIGCLYPILIFQGMYDIKPIIRRLTKARIICGISSEKWYKEDAERRFGFEAVQMIRQIQAMIEDGDYTKIGTALINLNVSQGSSTGYINFPMKEGEFPIYSEVYDTIINLEDYIPKRELTKAGRPKSVIVDDDTWTGLDKHLIELVYENPKIIEHYKQGITAEDGEQIWRNHKPIRSKKLFNITFQERLKGFVLFTFEGLVYDDIGMELNKDRAIKNITGMREIDPRSYMDYLSPLNQFFKQKQISKFFGESVMESFIQKKLNFVLQDKEFVDSVIQIYSDDETKKARAEKILKTQFLSGFSGSDLSWADGSFLCNIKYQSVVKGTVQPTPECHLVKEDDLTLGVLIVSSKARMKGRMRLGVYRGDCVKSEYNQKELFFIDGYKTMIKCIIENINK